MSSSSDLNPATPPVAEAPKLPSPLGSERRALWTGVLAIFVLAFATYWPALRGGFVWDDMILVEKNQLAKGDLNLRTVWFSTDFPLTTVLFWIQWLLWGKNTLGYHVVNVLLHAISSVLVWRVLVRLKIPGAWLAGVLFAVHPVCVASVAWISELKNVLSLPFCLLSFWWYLGFEKHHAEHRLAKARWSYWLSLVAFALALLSKTSVVMLPVVLLICAWWQRDRVTRQDLLRTSPHFALALGFGLMTVWFQNHHVIGAETVQTENSWGRLAGAGMAIWFYLGKAVFPVNLTMIYPRWEIDASAVLSYRPLLLFGSTLTVCWWFRRAWGRHVLFALGCFAVALFPVLGFFDMLFLQFSRVSDHLQYPPLIAVMGFVAAGVHTLLPARTLRFVAPVLVLALCGLTAQRARVFASDEKLWADTVAKNPAAWNAHNNVGCIRAEQNRITEAIQHFEASLKVNPRNAQAHINLGKALAMQGKFIEAESHFQSALDIRPSAEAHAFFGSALAARGKMPDALKHLREAVRLKPDVETRLHLAAMLRAGGNVGEAIEQTRLALATKPDMPEVMSNLAWLLATASDDSLRDGAEAVRLAEQACRLTEFKQARMVGALAAAYAEAGRFNDAITTAQKAIELARATGDGQFAGINEQLLKLYQSGRAYHEPSKNRDAL
jgi:tetratricopeptide (TPR) repeat protein